MILITGATGFIGKKITEYLINKNEKIRLFVRDEKKAKKLFPNADIVRGDFSDPKTLRKALQEIKTVIHLAGVVSYKASWESLYRENVLPTKILVSQSKASGVKKFIFASSVSVYGPSKNTISEKSPLKPSTLYGKSKFLAEEAVLLSGIPYCILRIGPVYGAGSKLWIRAIKMFDKGFRIPKTKNRTSLVHVNDVAQAFYLSLSKGGGVYNIAEARQIPIMGLCKKIILALGNQPKYIPLWLARLLVGLASKGGDFNAFVQDRNYDISKAKKELGYEPHADFDKEVKRMVMWYKNLNITG